MKKVLFATTALVAFAGAASAEATVGGYGYAGVVYDGAANTTSVEHAVRLTFSASVDTDAGVTFGAFARTNISNTAGHTGTVAGTTATTKVFNQQRITMDAGGLSVRIGSTHGAMKTLARNATFHGFQDGGGLYVAGGSGVDNNTSGLNDSGNNVLVQYTTGNVTVGVGTAVDGSEMDIGVKYTSGAFSIGAGYSDASEWMLAATYSSGDFSVGLGANSDDEFTLVANYAVSAATSINFGYDSADVYGLQVSHSLGNGASLVGNVGRVQSGDMVAGAGVFFSF